MGKVHVDLGDSLNRINIIFKNAEVFTECIKKYESFSILGEKFGPFEKGKNYRLKFFLALPFIENNILKIAPSDKCDNIDVQRYAIAEKDNQQIVQRNNDFFLNRISEFKYFLEKEVKDGNRTTLDLDRYNSYLSNIIDSRVLKLLRMSRSELSLTDENRLTSSEKMLFDLIHKYIKTWRTFFLKRI